jgi:very-short-patch-repair endonuclease
MSELQEEKLVGRGAGSGFLSIWFPFPRGKGLGVRVLSVNQLMTHGSKITRVQSVRADKLSFAKRLRREMTPAERILWKALRRNGIEGFHFRRQQVIEGYVVDFYCDAAKLAIELDGGVHEEQWKYDETRDRTISRMGVRVLRISNEAMFDSEAAIEHIRQALRESSGT